VNWANLVGHEVYEAEFLLVNKNQTQTQVWTGLKSLNYQHLKRLILKLLNTANGTTQ
jgi:hypothetical protein